MIELYFFKKNLWVILFLFMLFPGLGSTGQKPRLLIITDIGGDPDDQQSLIRLMVYSNEFEIEGIIASASGTPGELKEAIVRPDLVEEIVSAYQEVHPNLLKHDKNYPDPANLFSIIKKGNPSRGLQNIGEGHDTEGSDWIIRSVDKKDKRPLNICIFGGQTDLAQALWKVKNSRSEKAYQRFISSIRIYDINDQDRIFSHIHAKHPGLFYILAKAPEGVDKREGAYRGIYLGGDESLTSLEWLKEHVLDNRGPLGKLYPVKTWTAPNPYGNMKEGDTPSWFFFLQNGLNVPEKPECGGWGGRFILNEKGYFSDATDTFRHQRNARATVCRWREDFQHDWAARMDWCVKEYDQCNHPPVIAVNRSKGKEMLTIRVKAGKTITLDATATTDPDGHSLRYEWFFYPGNNNLPEIITTRPGIAGLEMPSMKKGESLYLVLKVTDDGTPNLTTYKRIRLIAGKKSGDALAKKKIALLIENIEIATIDREITRKAALNSQIHDFEDGLEYYSALQQGCDCIITENREDFYFREIEVVNCETFLMKF